MDLWLAGWGSTGNTMDHSRRAMGYVGLALSQAIFIMALSASNATATNRASRNLHAQCVDRIMHAPTSWFEATPSGRILSRLSADMSLVDKMFGWVSDDVSDLLPLSLHLCNLPQVASHLPRFAS